MTGWLESESLIPFGHKTIMPLRTTVIGSFPKPEYLEVPNWFDAKMGLEGNFISDYNAFTKRNISECILEKARKEVIALQTDIGIDVITDGELQRENYVHYFCRKIKGFDFENPAIKSTEMAPADQRFRVLFHRFLHPKSRGFLRNGNNRKATLKIPVKITLPGPMTIINSTENKFYDDVKMLSDDLVGIIAREIHALADAGCKFIQIDEPLMVRQPDIALEYGIDNLTKCFAGLPDHVVKIVHLCCGYPNYLDEVGYPKADQKAYFQLAEKLDNGGFDELSIEDAHSYNDLSLLSKFKKTKIIFGVIGIARSRVESIDEVKSRLTEALKYIPAECLIVAPDCGLGFLSTDLAKNKLNVMVEAAKSV